MSSLKADEESLFYHCLAILNSSSYREENTAAVRHNWPRVPLPASKVALENSAKLGRQVAELYDIDHPVKGVTTGKIRSELKTVAIVSRSGGGTLDPEAGDLDVTALWGFAGKGGATMPGRGKTLDRSFTREESQAIEDGAVALGLDSEQALRLLGNSTHDIYLNDVAFWKNVPESVWDFTVGGFPVIKKWLSYKEKALLGRGLSNDECRGLTHIVRRLAALVLLDPSLNQNYRAVLRSTFSWVSEKPTS